MTWARLDDQFPWNRKARRLSDAAFRLHVTGIVACARDLTDGRVTPDDLDEFPPMRGVEKRLDELITRGLWHASGHDCPKCDPIRDGWIIHDYLDYNPSKADVEAERKAARDRQRQRRQRRAGIGDDGDVTRDSRVTHADVTRESQTPSYPTRPDPSYPSRPDPSPGVLRVVGDGHPIPNRYVSNGVGRVPIGLEGEN